MDRRTCLLLLLGLPRGADLRICGPLTRSPQFLTFDLSSWAGVKVRFDDQDIVMPSQVIWDELIRPNP